MSTQLPRTNRRTVAQLFLVTFAVELAVLGWWASQRGINADEGFYLAAARFASTGGNLYGGMFFPQMPYLPWLVGWVFQWTGPSLVVARLLSVVGAALTVAILAAIAWWQERRMDVVVAAVLLYVLSAVLVMGLPVVKAAALVNVCLLGAFALLAIGVARRPSWAFCAGLAAGCAIGLRLAVAPIALLLAFFALRLGRRAFVAYACGGLLASLPWLIAAARFPDEFWFCNVTFHGVRSEMPGLGATLRQKLVVLAKWFLLPQHAIVWCLVVYGVWWDRSRTYLALGCAAVLGATYAAATPTYVEYMTQILPFAILAALPGIARLGSRRWALAGLLAIYLLGFAAALRPPPTGSALAAKRQLWDYDLVLQVSDYVRSQTGPEDRVLSWWEGYPVLSGRPGVAGVGFWESNVAKKLSVADAKRYHVVRAEELRGLVERREPATIVVADGVWNGLRGAIEAGYVVGRRVGAVQVYTRKT